MANGNRAPNNLYIASSNNSARTYSSVGPLDVNNIFTEIYQGKTQYGLTNWGLNDYINYDISFCFSTTKPVPSGVKLLITTGLSEYTEYHELSHIEFEFPEGQTNFQPLILANFLGYFADDTKSLTIIDNKAGGLKFKARSVNHMVKLIGLPSDIEWSNSEIYRGQYIGTMVDSQLVYNP
ncbi:hypothetical protein MTZ49_00350 [Entomomonas sp. E2T0]|uniref:hypothetical protein n=1 Tax=Entomomonas sp. E2T0 TaxID=2930213 RepID=UPI0022282A79|nr:hypothetical protein [Entomomonas sp. E2T0]UYZ84075.1 hypothetical protein MTZ49_00350 [Entomomonas sp. E2T0]